ncbi:MAG: ADP-ribosylglycohydrolase family protein, partial [Ruminococcus sp.]|nr:ADP-ribosylglycohydrolase family protein [Ruminococcus sp.]
MVKDIQPYYSFDSHADYSVSPAIVAFPDSDDYESAVRNAVSLGGDADIFYADIPEYIKNFCYSRLDY